MLGLGRGRRSKYFPPIAPPPINIEPGDGNKHLVILGSQSADPMVRVEVMVELMDDGNMRWRWATFEGPVIP